MNTVNRLRTTLQQTTIALATLVSGGAGLLALTNMASADDQQTAIQVPTDAATTASQHAEHMMNHVSGLDR